MAETKYSTISPGISKLKGSSNYATWKMDMRGTLMRDGLWSAVDQSARSGSDEERTLRDQRAYGSIFVHLDQGPKLHIGDCITAKEAWDKLEKQYEAKTTNRRLFLLEQLFSNKLQPGGSIEEYINKFLDFSSQLAAIKKPVDDEMKACLLLMGLPESLGPFKMAMETAETLKYETVLEKLTAIGEKAELEKASPSSAFAVHKNGGGMRNERKFIPRCFKCNEPGHFARFCKKGKPNENDNVAGICANFNKSVTWITALNCNVESQGWYLDSCCTDNLSKNRDNFKYLDDNACIKNVTVADNSTIKTAGVGQVVVNLKGFGERLISNVTYVPNLSANLLSVGKIAQRDQVLVFDKKGCTIYNAKDISVKGTVTGTGTLTDGLYKLDTVSIPSCNKALVNMNCDKNCNEVAMSVVNKIEPQLLWHKRLGHLNSESMRLLKNKLATGIQYLNEDFKKCLPCVKGKMTRRTFSSLGPCSRASAKLELFHSDVCGPMKVESFQHNLYFVTFTDDYSRLTFCYFIKHKDEVAECFRELNILVKNQHNGQGIKVVRTDGGGEYIGASFLGVCKEFGIIHDTTSRYAAQQNGVAERLNRTLLEKARAMMIQANLGKAYWEYAIDVAVYLKNRSPTKAIFGATPYERWTGFKIDLSHLKVFGCQAEILVPAERRDKWDGRTKSALFVGYCPTKKNYKFVDVSYPRRVIVSTHFSFFEDRFKKCEDDSDFYCELDSDDNKFNVRSEPEPVETIVTINSKRDNDQNIVNNAEEPVDTILTIDEKQDIAQNIVNNEEEVLTVSSDTLEGSEDEIEQSDSESEGENNERVDVNVRGRYPVRYRKPKQFPDFVCFALSVDDQEPRDFRKAMSSSNRNLWLKAIDDEFSALEKNCTWDLVDLPAGKNLVQSKWVFKIKRNENGEAIKFKARLVAKGFTQKYGVDYFETFSPVVRFECLRILFALSVRHNLSIDHLDVNSAFLASELEEEIYMGQPEGKIKDGSEGKVCKLKKAIYGLKQASRAWNDKCNAVLSELGFTPLILEPCVFVYYSDDELAIIALYVDDFLLFCSSDELKIQIKKRLGEKFDIKDLGTAKNVLGMRIQRDNDGSLTLDQSAYVERLLKKHKLVSANSRATPMDEGLDPAKPDRCENGLDFQEIIGGLMYLAVCTRPDIAFAVTKLSQYNSAHNDEIYKYAKAVLRYVKGTQEFGLKFSADQEDLHGYVDASHGNNFDGRSFSGFVFSYCGAPVAWGSRKQRLIADSTTESEYIAMVLACKEAMFLKQILEELGICQKSVTLYCDNMSAMRLIQKKCINDRTKHISRKKLFVRQFIQLGLITLHYVPSENMKADILTKALGREKHERFCKELGLDIV